MWLTFILTNVTGIRPCVSRTVNCFATSNENHAIQMESEWCYIHVCHKYLPPFIAFYTQMIHYINPITLHDGLIYCDSSTCPVCLIENFENCTIKIKLVTE